MAEQANANNNVAFKGKTFLRFKELLLETCASAKGDNWILAYHDDLHDALQGFIEVFLTEGENMSKNAD